MAVFPDFLYRLSPRDEQVTALEVVFYNFPEVNDSNTLVITGDYVVPDSRLLILTSVGINLTAGAGQVPVMANVSVYDTSGIFYAIYSRMFQDNLNQLGYAADFNNCILTPGQTIRGTGVFDIGANPNYVSLQISGIFIPRGNFAI